MIVTVTFDGKLHGSPIEGLRDDDLFWLIKEEIKKGRTVHIAPSKEGGEKSAKNV